MVLPYIFRTELPYILHPYLLISTKLQKYELSSIELLNLPRVEVSQTAGKWFRRLKGECEWQFLGRKDVQQHGAASEKERFDLRVRLTGKRDLRFK